MSEKNNSADSNSVNINAQQSSVDQPTTEKAKVPAQFFQWFDSLRQGYENSINKLFNRVEKVNEDHKAQIKNVYQSQIEGLKKSYQDHLHTLKSSNQSQLDQAQARIKQLEKDALFYQEQLKTQNRTIDKLNDRYDAVIFALKDKMDNKELEKVIKDISPQVSPNNQPSLSDNSTTSQQPAEDKDHSTAQPVSKAQSVSTQESSTNKESSTNNHKESSTDKESSTNNHKESSTDKESSTNKESSTDKKSSTDEKPLNNEQSIEQTMSQAFKARQDKLYEQAYELFYNAATQGNEKAMGAIGRAHFVGEGVPQDKTTGLAWLIKAAEHQFEPAMKKVAGAKQKSPELYQNALKISSTLF